MEPPEHTPMYRQREEGNRMPWHNHPMNNDNMPCIRGEEAVSKEAPFYATRWVKVYKAMSDLGYALRNLFP